MSLGAIQVGEAAELLHAAQIGRAPIDPLTARYPGLGVVDAYAIQQVNLARRLSDGRTVVGHKIGLTSAAMQALLGVDEPDFGYILDDMVIRRWWFHAVLCPARRTRSRLPAAPAAARPGGHRCRRTCRDGGGRGRAGDRRQPDCRLAVDVARYRRRQRQLRSRRARRLGAIRRPLRLADARASLVLNGTEIDSGVGSAVMGDPAAAVAWLANALAPFGTDILSGEFVMSGSFTTAAFVHPGDHASATISGLGSVSLSFSEGEA